MSHVSGVTSHVSDVLCQVSHIAYHLSPFRCHLALTPKATATDHPRSNSHITHSRLVAKTQRLIEMAKTQKCIVPCADTFTDKLLLDGSQSREHKGPPPLLDTTAELMHSTHFCLLNIP